MFLRAFLGCIVGFVFADNSLFAQTGTHKNPVRQPISNYISEPAGTTQFMVDSFDGTYQFIFKKGIIPAFADEVFAIIESSRRDDDDILLPLSEYCDVKIISRHHIHAPEFIPFETAYIFLTHE